MEEWKIRTLIGIACAATGWLVGHKLALGREKRKEYNAAVEPIRCLLINDEEVSGSVIKTLETVLGRDSGKIIKEYNVSYKPSILRAHELLNTNEYGEPQGDEDECTKIFKEATKRLLKKCELK